MKYFCYYYFKMFSNTNENYAYNNKAEKSATDKYNTDFW